MPDPKELLAKARAMALRMQSDGVPAEQIDQYMKQQAGLSLEQVMSPDVTDYLRAAGMGASFGFLDELAGAGAALVPGGKGYTEARDEVRANYDAAKKVAPKRMLAAEVAGGIGSALVGGELAGAAGQGIVRAAPWLGRAMGIGEAATRGTGILSQALRGARAGAVAGGLSGAGYSNETGVAGQARDAVVGAGVGAAGGAALPTVIGGIGKGLGVIHDLAAPGQAVSKEVATQMPANAAATIARQEALAPGTALAGDLTPEMTALTRGVGADPAAAQSAKAIAADRVQQLRAALRAVGQEKDQFKGVRLPLTPEAKATLVRNGHMVSNEVDFDTADKLRTKLLERMRDTKKGSVKQELAPQIKALSDLMETHIPGISEINSKYAFLMERSKAAMQLLKEVTASSKSYAASRVYGVDAGSIGGNLPSGSKGLMGRLAGALEPNKADRARVVQQMLLTPGAPLIPQARLPMPGARGLLEIPAPAFGYLAGRGLLGSGQ